MSILVGLQQFCSLLIIDAVLQLNSLIQYTCVVRRNGKTKYPEELQLTEINRKDETSSSSLLFEYQH